MVRTFHVPMLVVVLVEMMVVGLVASRGWLSLPGVITPQTGGPSPRTELSFEILVSVSVVVAGFTGTGVLTHRPTLLLCHPAMAEHRER